MGAILLIGQYFSRVSCRCSSYNLSLGSFDMVDLRLWDVLSRWHSSWRVFTLLMCMPFYFGLGTSTHVCSWSITDRYIIKWHISHTWYGCWTIKALVKAEVYDGFTVICRGIAAPFIITRCLVSFYLKIIRLAKNLFLRQKCFTDTGCACTSSVASKRAVIKWLAKTLLSGGNLPIC